MGELTLKENLIGWLLVLLTGGAFAGCFLLWRSVDARRSVTVSPGIDTIWQIPAAYVGRGFDDLRPCEGDPTSAASKEGLVELGAWQGEAAVLAPIYVGGPPALDYRTHDVSVAPYWSLEPPELTVRLAVRLTDPTVEPPPRVDLAFRGCVRLLSAYWEDTETDAASTLRKAREGGDPATVARAEALIEELAQRKALLGRAHEVAGAAHFEVRSATTAGAALLAGGYYVLLALTAVSGLALGYCMLTLYLRLKAA